MIKNKYLIATILQKHLSTKRVEKYAEFLDKLIKSLGGNISPSELDLVRMSGLDGKIIVGSGGDISNKFSDEVKSSAFINTALSMAIKCPICKGYLDVEKSVSYDHVTPERDGGLGNLENCHLTHPYCNQSVKS